MIRLVKILLVSIAVLLVASFAANRYYYASGPLAEPVTVLFTKGTGFRAIVDQLEEKGVISHGWLFKIVAVTLGDARRFKAGEYEFTAAISPRLVMDMIAEGRVVVHKLVVPEGMRSADVIALLSKEPLLEGDILGEVREGALLPETYHFTYGEKRRDVLERMKAGMDAALAELWAKRKEGLPIATPQEAVTLASIVEKETSIPSERGRIASVFINRLRKGMKLQSDPTVIYAIEKDKGPLGRLLVTKDLAYSSPYNTYAVGGLPPGPIANPGRHALEATLSPPESKDLYFVATGNGGHHFSESLAGHNRNVAQYRKLVKAAQQEQKKKDAGAKKKP